MFSTTALNRSVTTEYCPQANGQVEVSNREVNNILMKIIRLDEKDWAHKLLDALWAYGRLTRHPSGCLQFDSYSGKHAIFQLSLSIEHIGQSRSSTYL